MHVGYLWKLGHRLADPRVIFHRAGAEEADVHHPERFLAKMQIMALHLGVCHFGESGRFAPRETFRDQTLRVRALSRAWEDLAAPAGMAELHDKGLVPDRGVVVAQPWGILAVHDVTARSIAEANRSMSASEWI